MSEYQDYEFRAIDRALTAREMADVRKWSTRAEITPVSFVNTYEWGDFKGNPDALVKKYYAVFFYFANWGTRILKLRLPSSWVDLQKARPYCAGESAALNVAKERVVFSFLCDQEAGDTWDGGEEDLLPSLISLRTDLKNGDCRVLYLGWLLAVQQEEVAEDAVEPPVPPGLGSLSPALKAFIEFLRVDSDLVDAAAEGPAGGRSAGDLLAAAERIRTDRQRKETERAEGARERMVRQAAAARAKYLQELRGREAKVWGEIDTLIGRRNPKAYGEALRLIRDLGEILKSDGRAFEFTSRLRQLRETHAKKGSLVAKLDSLL